MIPVNRECCASLAAILYHEDLDGIVGGLRQAALAIYDGRAILGLDDDEARDFANRFAATVLDELAKLWLRPPPIQ